LRECKVGCSVKQGNGFAEANGRILAAGTQILPLFKEVSHSRRRTANHPGPGLPEVRGASAAPVQREPVPDARNAIETEVITLVTA
jgi:hypothetical protein